MAVLDYVNLHKIPVILITVAVIFFIGLLKTIKVFDKITNKDLKKGILFSLSIVLSFAGAAIYYAIKHFAWNRFWLYGLIQSVATIVCYAFYEDLGPRKLIQLLFTWCGSLFKKKNVDLTFLKELGLPDEFIEKIGEAIKTELNRVMASKTETKPEDPTEVTVKTE